PPSTTSPLSLHDALPISDRAHSQARMAVRALPRCSSPVGLGANRPRSIIGRIFVSGQTSARSGFLNPGVGRRIETLETLGGSHRSEEHTSELQSPCNLVC